MSQLVDAHVVVHRRQENPRCSTQQQNICHRHLAQHGGKYVAWQGAQAVKGSHDCRVAQQLGDMAALTYCVGPRYFSHSSVLKHSAAHHQHCILPLQGGDRHNLCDEAWVCLTMRMSTVHVYVPCLCWQSYELA